MKRIIHTAVLFTVLALSHELLAEPKVDVEVDPIAYALGGHSLHVGIQQGRFRLDLGAFGLDVPEGWHGNEGFDFSMAGAGVKLDYFVFQPRTGFFVGAKTSVVTNTIIETESTMAERHLQVNVGGRIGYRIPVGESLFLSPWVGVAYASGGDREINGKTYEKSHLSIFPTVHLGYRFR